MKRKPAKQQPSVKVGDHVLLGGTRASYPGHWYLGMVLWAGNGDLLVERYTLNGERWRQQQSIHDVRAVGPLSELVAIQNAASKEVAELVSTIGECESALGRARDALWARLEEMAEGGLKVIPPDFDAIEADQQARRALMERHETEHSATAQ
jgi:hypothetical protein